jgi:hypothetical protein
MPGSAGDKAAASPSVITLGIAGGSGGGKVSERIKGLALFEMAQLTQISSLDDPRAGIIQGTWRRRMRYLSCA